MGIEYTDEIFNDNDFEECFNKVDTDKSGVIDKNEMLQFIKIVTEMN